MFLPISCHHHLSAQNDSAGGASGIGAATVRLLNAALAFVVFGDSAQEAAEELIASLDQPENVTFVLTNVSSYESNYALFRSAFEKYGRIDHAISIAGISERENWFDPALTLTDIKKEPDTLTLDVNLKGVLFFARIAMVYLRAGNEKRNRSLTLFSSVAGFRPTPGLAIYQVCCCVREELQCTDRDILTYSCPSARNTVCSD